MARVAIIGTGWGARVQVPAFREAGLEVVAIAGHDREKTRRIAGELGVRALDSWRDVLATDADLISVVTPPFEHLEMAVGALESGKHVLSEKPTAMSSAEAEMLLATAKRHPERIAIIDHELRFLPAWLETKRLLPELGAVRYADVRYASPARGDRTRAWNWWSDEASGGGIWGAVGSHFVDALRYFGMDVKSVSAQLETIIAERPFDGSPREVTTDDYGAVQLRFTDGAVAAIHLSVVSAGPDEPSVITIHCEGGAIRLTGEEALLSTGRQPYRRIAGSDLQERPGNSPGGAFGTGTLLLGQALRSAIDDGNRGALAPAATFADGLAQQRILDAARESSRAGGWVRVEE